VTGAAGTSPAAPRRDERDRLLVEAAARAGLAIRAERSGWTSAAATAAFLRGADTRRIDWFAEEGDWIKYPQNSAFLLFTRTAPPPRLSSLSSASVINVCFFAEKALPLR
jgi:hypothetical protein